MEVHAYFTTQKTKEIALSRFEYIIVVIVENLFVIRYPWYKK